jgi:signal transduction histidine kinase
MQSAAQRMQNLINALLAYSRVTTRGQPFVAVDLGEVAREVLADLEASIEQTGASVHVGHLPVIEADPTQMRQLLQNLAGNALKFHREDEPPRVLVHGRVLEERDAAPAGPCSPGTMCQIAVEDNGIGFDEKYLDCIFGVFQRLHGRGVYAGTGMGLAICRKIADRHGGSITAASTLGRGSVFTVVLPVRQNTAGGDA